MKNISILFYDWLLNSYRSIVMLSDVTLQLNYLPSFTKIRSFNARIKAYAEYLKAKKRVPAYKEFLNRLPKKARSFSDIPEIDKSNYVKIFSLDTRCVGGKIPCSGVVIDESSGSTGEPTNWVRGYKERAVNARLIKFGMRKLFGNDPMFIINAFALGAWATGINITMSSLSFARVKSLGPDIEKIENTLLQFGKKQNYIIMGYPPFLKHLVDNSMVDWQEYKVSFIFGGESMSEGMRDYLTKKGIEKIYSSFGASDLELNIASENDFTISLRRLINTHTELKDRLLKYTGALPMVFQYNPTDFLIESTDKDELIISICRPNYVAPKLRYNIHDRGHVMEYKEIVAVLKDLGLQDDVIKPASDLPLLFHYGRSDMAVSFFGSNISPEDVQEVLYNMPEISSIVNSYSLTVNESEDGDKELLISFELQKNVSHVGIDMPNTTTQFYDLLASINQDFRKGREMATNPDRMKINFEEFGKGHFANNDIRIKAKYLA